jgi:hypothetical protein
VPYLLFFTFHWMVVFCTAVFPVSWGDSKTVHGVEADHGILPWIGVDGRQSAKMGLIVLAITTAWIIPLFQGLAHAPSPMEAPILQAGRSLAVVMAGADVLDGCVQGTVRDQYDQAVDGASVVLTGGGQTYRTRSNASGDFLFADVPQGQYHISVTADGYQTAETDFVIENDRGVWVSVTLASPGGGVVVIPIPY